ncbi:unnamed protein product [Rhizopus stolonifer]
MDCCLEAPPSYNRINYSQNSSESPQLGISLELPTFEDYLPTYWPGQSINGKLQVQLSTPTNISHLRVVLYGGVQVFGKRRDIPLSNGLFDYQKNIQVINKGMRIIKRPTNCTLTDSEYRQSLTNQQDNESPKPAKRHRWKLNSKQRVGVNQSKKQKIDDEEMCIQKLVKEIADADFEKDTSHGVFDDADFVHNFPSDKNCTFDLEAKTHHIGFSVAIPMSKSLPGTLDHQNYPITYRLVAIMRCSDDNKKETMCYSTTKVCLEPFVDIQSPKFSSSIRSSPIKVLVPGSSSAFRSLYSCLQSSSMIMNSLLVKSICPKTRFSTNALLSAPPQLLGYMELPRQAFERSENIPLKVKLSNTCSNFRISTLKIQVQLLQSINMTCSFGETAEHKAIVTKSVVFKNSDDDTENLTSCNDGIISLDGLNICFDLSKLVKVPSNATCSISSEATRETFSLVHDIGVKLEIEGALIKKSCNQEPKIEMTEVVYSPNQENTLLDTRVPERIATQDHIISKKYCMDLGTLPIAIGNSGYEFKIDV